MSEPTTHHARTGEPSDPRIRRPIKILVGALIPLGLIVVARALGLGAGPLDWLAVLLVAVAGVATIVHLTDLAALTDHGRDESASFTRILSALSRSVSPDAIVGAIVEELGQATDADHVVVVRRRPDARVLEARMVSSRAGIPESTTLLPIADLEDPLPGAAPTAPTVAPSIAAQQVAERVARRVRTVYGLTNTLAAPLTVGHGVVGAIVVSRRSERAWPDAPRRMLASAAREASASLSRAYSHRDAETRAATDPLTGLPNRRYFDEYVSLLAQRRRAGDAVGVLMVDIDRFKSLNDRHGHATGDVVLRAVAAAIVSAVREDDVPARFGGEEFVVLLRNPSPAVAVEVGERIRHAVRTLELARHGVGGVSVSVGVAVASRPDADVAELIDAADRALYRAKRAGRDRVMAA